MKKNELHNKLCTMIWMERRSMLFNLGYSWNSFLQV